MFKQVDRVADRVGVATPRSWKRMVPLLGLMGIILVSAAVFTSQGAGLRILLYPLPTSVYEPELHVSGVAEPYQSLMAELNGFNVARTLANESGDFVITFNLQPGVNRLRVVSDEAGSTSVSDTHRIQYTPMTTGQAAGEAPAKPRFSLRSLLASVKAMVAPAAAPAVAPAVAPSAPVLNVPASTTTANPITVSGTAEAQSTVHFYVNGRYTRNAIANASGAFSTWVPLEDGLNSIYAVTETASGQSSASNTVQTTYTNTIARTQSGAITQNTVWTAGNGSPYSLVANVSIAAGATLWIQPGATIQSADYYKVQVDGALVVNGTSASRAVLKPATAACNGTTTQRSDWLGIEVSASGTATIDYAQIECASKAVHFNGGTGTLRNSRLLNNYMGVEMVATAPARTTPQITTANEIRGSYYGLAVYRNTSPTISGGNVITGNVFGLLVYGNSIEAQNPLPVVTGNSVFGNTSHNYYTYYFGNPGAVRLNATSNWWGTTDPALIAAKIYDWSDSPTVSPVVDYGGYLGAADGMPVFTGTTLNGPITSDRTLAAGEHQMLGNVEVRPGVTLTVGAGANLTVPMSSKLQVDGTLLVQGTAASRVVMRPTTAACNGTATQRSDWTGIEVSASGTATIDYAQIECASKAVYFNGGTGTLRNSRLLNNYTGVEMVATASARTTPQITTANEIRGSAFGLAIYPNTSPTVSGGNVITDNTYGVYVQGNGTEAQNPLPVVTGNSLHGNSSYAYYTYYFGNPGAVRLNATGNWWGTTDPALIAAKIYDWSDSPTVNPVVDYGGYLGASDGTPVFSGMTLLGPITTSRTLAAGEHQVLGRVEVRPGVTLTLSAGANVTVPVNAKLQVDGTLRVQGTVASRVVMRPTTAACNGTATSRSDWTGIEVSATGTAMIEYAQIECASKAVHFNGGTGTLRNSRLLNNYMGVEMVATAPARTTPQITTANEIRGSYYGLLINPNTSPTVSGGNVITDNVHGLFVQGNYIEAQNPLPVVTGNSLFGNSSYNYYTYYFGNPGAVRLNATGNWWGTIDPALIAGKIYDWADEPTYHPVVDYSGYLGASDGTPVFTGTTLLGPITTSRTLAAGEHQVLGRVEVRAGVTLTLSAGANVTVPVNAKLQVDGTLLVQGTAASRVVMRPTTAACNGTATSRSDWLGIEVSASGTATIDYAQIECASKAVYFNGGTGTLRNSRLLNNYTGVQMVATAPARITPQITTANEIRGSYYGLLIYQNTSPTISGGNVITGNAFGLLVQGNYTEAQNPLPVVTGNSLFGNSTRNYYTSSFSNSDDSAVRLDATGNWWGTTDPGLIAANIYDWSDNPMYMPLVDYSRYLGAAGGTPDYTGETLSGPITANRTLAAGDHRILGNVIVNPGVTLTLAPGAIVKVATGNKLQVGGSLVAQGTPTQRVAFGSAAFAQARGDWYGIEVLSTGSVTLDYARIENATYGVRFAGGQGTVHHSLIRYCTYGIYVDANSSPSITQGNEITNNDYGIYVTGNSITAQNPAPIVTGNNLYANSSYNYYATTFGNPAATTLDATGNWWGTTSEVALRSKISLGTTFPIVNYAGFLAAPIGKLAIAISGVSMSVQQSQPLVPDQPARGVFSISAPGTVVLQVRRESDNAVVFQQGQSYPAAGQYTFTWAGRDQQGAAVPVGLYRAVLIADDGVDGIIYDPPVPLGEGSVSGWVPALYRPYRNENYKINVDIASPSFVTMQVTPQNGTAFFPFRDVLYPPGNVWLHWDGRDPSGQLITVPVEIYYPPPTPARPMAIAVLAPVPRISGTGTMPNIEVKSDPYTITHSYEQVTRMAYRLDSDATVRFTLLPPGVINPSDPSAIVLVNNELKQAKDAGGAVLDHVVEWRGYDPLQPSLPRTAPEGAYTFAIEATSVQSSQKAVYRGIVNLYK